MAREYNWKTGCDVEATLSVIGGRWKPVLVCHLLDGTKRFGELRRLTPNATERMITLQLRELEADGVISRRVYTEVPPRVEYSITEFGRSLDPILHVMQTWGRTFKARRLAEERGDTMPTSGPHPKVDAFVDSAGRWQPEVRKLRDILLACGLDETFKWRSPCYSVDGRNVAIIQPFKELCALMFFKGVLLDDPRGLLKEQGANTQSARRLEFRSETDIKKTVVRAFVKQAIGIEAAGRGVDFKAKHALELPEELSRALAKSRRLKKAFSELTPGRQRGYVLHISAAKQSKTRTARVEKCLPGILAGKGINGR